VVRTVAIVARKGGVGKSTLAIHLAVAALGGGRPVALVDLDPQRSAGEWWRARAAAVPVLVEPEPSALPAVLDAARADGFGWCIVDTAPHSDVGTVTAARLADLALIPTRPGILDLRAIGATVEAVKALGTPAAIVLNHCPPARGFGSAGLVSEARTALAVYGLPVCSVTITQRAALAHALITGQAVGEFEPDGKAAAEINALWRWIEERAGNGGKAR
jgi:chromosome partitioning protein